MRNRIFRLATLAAVSLVTPIAAPSAQVMTLPRPQQAFDRALARLAPAQRAEVIRLPASPEEAAP